MQNNKKTWLSRNLHVIDLKKAWWSVLGKEKYRAFSVFMGTAVVHATYTLVPLLGGWAIAEQSFRSVFLFCSTVCLVYFLEYIVKTCNDAFQISVINSVSYSAYRFFITVDPVMHAKRSTGIIMSKIRRTGESYDQLMDAITSDDGLVEMGIGTLTVLVTLFYVDGWLGLLGFITTLVFVLANFFTFKSILPLYDNVYIMADDIVRGKSNEILSQVLLIRSCFASSQADSELKALYGSVGEAEARLKFQFRTLRLLFKCAYLVYVGSILSFIIYLTQAGRLTPVFASSLFLTFLKGTGDLVKLDKPIKFFFQACNRIKDFFSFVHLYGEQTFPVLESLPLKESENGKEKISILMTDLSFDYDQTSHIFDDHTLHLEVDKTQACKLYGIIGPSGIGKTTLLSILGGQLKPKTGNVCINGQDIYCMNDEQRCRYIAMQSQVSISFRGTLKYNLLFGIPPSRQAVSDAKLIELLNDIGIWSLFASKQGLETIIGEGGSTLSGGQKQRIAFANLYLRARSFKPRVLLIDEPTSSLDAKSEQKITDIIQELSREAVTIVIAHRLSTLEQAQGILDFSGIATKKDMIFHAPSQLLKQSNYFSKLSEGKESLEEKE